MVKITHVMTKIRKFRYKCVYGIKIMNVTSIC